MRVAVLGLVVGLSLVIAIVGSWFQRSSVYAQLPGVPAGTHAAGGPSGAGGVRGTVVTRGVASDQLIALTSDVDGRQQITLIDPKTRVMGVYHVDRASGEISLKSVRNVQWDLLMEEFNGASPSPREIRSLLEQR